MKIITEPNRESGILYLVPGAQLTFHATGLVGEDFVRFELLELSEAPPQPDSFCCAIPPTIEVVGAQPLNCADGRAMRLTELLPAGVMDGPQGIYIRLVVEAAPASVVTVYASDTESEGCDRCICDYPCEIVEWLPTGEYRCDETTDQYQQRELSNCGTYRWVDLRPIEWVDTGVTRCTDTDVEVQQVNDCGQTRWVTGDPLTWTPTGAEHCDDTNVWREERNDCNEPRWVVDRAVTWIETGNKTCQGNFLMHEERNDCGHTRWVEHSAITWAPTGATRCDATNFYHEEISSCCDCEPRWINDGPLTRAYDGHDFCLGDDYYLVQLDDCGRRTSVLSQANAVFETGETRCNKTTHRVEVKRVNRCGVVSWAPTNEICGYCASYPLPGGGYGFVDPADMPPGAVLAIEACATGGPAVYLMATPTTNGVGYPYATKPVRDGEGALLGYAVNTSDCAPEVHPVEECDNCYPHPNGPQPAPVLVPDLAVYVRYDEHQMCMYEGDSSTQDFTDLFIVEVREVNGALAAGPTTITIEWTQAGSEQFELDYDGATTVSTLDGVAVDNTNWAGVVNPDGTITLTYAADIPAFASYRIAVRGRFLN